MTVTNTDVSMDLHERLVEQAVKNKAHEIFAELFYVASMHHSDVANILTPVYHELRGKTWGILGLGNIGRQVANVALALGCNVVAYKRTPDDTIPCFDLEYIFKNSDIISVHLPLNEATAGIVDRKLISLMKKDAILIGSKKRYYINCPDFLDVYIFKSNVLLENIYDSINGKLIEIETIDATNIGFGNAEKYAALAALALVLMYMAARLIPMRVSPGCSRAT